MEAWWATYKLSTAGDQLMWRSISLNMDRGYTWMDEYGTVRRAPGEQDKNNTSRGPQKILYHKNVSIENADCQARLCNLYKKNWGVNKISRQKITDMMDKITNNGKLLSGCGGVMKGMWGTCWPRLKKNLRYTSGAGQQFNCHCDNIVKFTAKL